MPELMQCYDLSQSEIQNEMYKFMYIATIDRRIHVVLNTKYTIVEMCLSLLIPVVRKQPVIQDIVQ